MVETCRVLLKSEPAVAEPEPTARARLPATGMAEPRATVHCAKFPEASLTLLPLTLIPGRSVSVIVTEPVPVLEVRPVAERVALSTTVSLASKVESSRTAVRTRTLVVLAGMDRAEL